MASGSMSRIMDEEFMRDGFNPEAFIRSHWTPNDDVRKLQALRGQIQTQADDSAQVIKKNVFQNYTQFIETAREISYLENEMYQLSHHLTEQKNLIDGMMDLSFSGASRDKGMERHKSSEDRHKGVQQLLDKVEGCNHLTDNTQRYVVFDSDLTELNPDSCTPVRQVHAFLLNDCLMMTSWIAHRLGPMRYKYEAMYQLETLAVKSIEDSSIVKNAFKLTIFPEQRTYQCENSKLKKKWLDAIDLVKKQMLREGSLMRQATIRMKKERETFRPLHEPKNVDERRNSHDSECESEWLRELPDELDHCIGQRDFDGAVELLFEGKDYLEECAGSSLAREAKYAQFTRTEKILQRENQLVDILCNELRSSGDQALKGGPKAARRAILLLVKLGRESKNRSLVIKQSVRELKITDVALTYVQMLTRIVFTHLLDAGKDFTKLFADSPGCLAVLMLWASGELRNYVQLMFRNAFDPGPPLSVIGQCVRLARVNVEQLAEIGLDLQFELDELLANDVEKLIVQNRENFLAALAMRISEDKWKPSNLQSEASLLKYVEDMRENGLDLEPYVFEQASALKSPKKERCWLWLTPQVCHFARAAFALARDFGSLRSGDHEQLVDDAVVAIWRCELTHLKTARNVPQGILEENNKFLRSYLLPLCENKFKEAARIKNWQGLSRLISKEFTELPGDVEIVGDV